MAGLGSLDSVSVFVKDRKRAREFYTRKVGLKVREEDRRLGLLLLGATATGSDASLAVWQPDRERWGEGYDEAAASIGTVTGIGLATRDMERTIAGMKRRGVELRGYEPDGTFANLVDPDGNVVFIVGPRNEKPRRAGLFALTFVTVVSRDSDRAGAWFTEALGMRRVPVPGDGDGFVGYRLSPRETMIGPFTPEKGSYDNPSDYDADMAHIGEYTGIVFSTQDIHGAQEALMGRGVRFAQKAEPTAWGGWDASFLDPDDNEYTLIQRGGGTRKP